MTSSFSFLSLSGLRNRMLILGSLLLMIGGLPAQPLDMNLLRNMSPRSIGPAGMSGRVTAIDAVINDPDIIYVGTASGGLWKSESGGIHWKPIFDEQPVSSIGAVAVCQSNPAVVWAGTGEGNPRNSQSSGAGIFRSLDAGVTWQCMGLENTRQIHRIIIHPTNPDIVYAGVQGVAWGESEHRGVYKTTDGGKTWQKILYVNPSTGVADMVIDPENPNKLIVAMWEFRRWPWIFKSGGPGSSLHITHDGGTTWHKSTHEDGLPEGELGRIGVAIARSNPKIVYALVEAKENALYRSQDGGKSWYEVNKKEEIGGRPFYYAEIYVDPLNENRLYTVHTIVSKSEDGGKSFEVIVPYNDIHPDHHAFWIHPTQPSFIIEGNDGGMAISRDMGTTWQFVETLPLAQFYHINVDMDMPYHVYGGMQDNGSWRGPGYVWKTDGIRNGYWEEVMFGDGFDVMPDPDNSLNGYAMSQGGYLGYYDVATGAGRFIRPVHPEGKNLRFNWNSAIAQDPFNNSTLYYGSQFVHKSTDKGKSWTIISPDLTTNDPEKQKQYTSGGLTLDVTAAENHCTILTIAPSPVEKNVIWAGTDDGNVQLTRDGGASWTLMTSRLPGVPKNAWVPQIHPSNHSAGEAFVVVNNYRQNDWTPYLYHTRDYGATWTRILDAQDAKGYAICVVQDPVAANLLFAGTETGLYVSIDAGANWTRWKHDFPTVQVMDLKIHPREHDLVIGTFGRAAWILDDIRPLREIAQEKNTLLERDIHLFDIPDAVMAEYAQAPGTRFVGASIYQGENRGGGARISFYAKVVPPAQPAPTPPPTPAAKPAKKAKPAPPAPATPDTATTQPPAKPAKLDSVKLEVLNPAREVIRTLYVEPDTGINRVTWGLDAKGVRFPGREMRGNREPGGTPILPGTYTVRVSWKGSRDSATVRVLPDPRTPYNEAEAKAQIAHMADVQAQIQRLTSIADRLKETRETVAGVEKWIPAKDTAYKELRQLGKAVQDSVRVLNEMIAGPENPKGIIDDSQQLVSKVFGVMNYVGGSGMGTPSLETSLRLLQADIDAYVARVNAFYEKEWKTYREKVEAAHLNPFKPYEPLR